ncbi:MAG: cobalamin biosynthesis protein CobD [Proteobacteria bacterium]|nr:cobalamin biosynthesis protein CobD [Pseudomonadota bacterium]
MVSFVPHALVDPLVLLLLALAVDAVFGDMPLLFRWVPHPVAVAGSTIEFLERRLNRDTRDEATRRLRGAVVAAAVALGAAAAGIVILEMTRQLAWGWAIETFLAAVLVAQRSLHDHVKAVAAALDAGGLTAGRDVVRHIVGRDPESLDEHGVARAAIESLAENFADGVVAPVFWYVIAGLPGMLAYKAVNTLDSMIGHRSPRYLAFGMVAARLDTAMNFLPARIAGLIFAIAAVIAPTANPGAALRTMWRDAGKHRSLNAGWPEGAMAGALGVALAGPRRYGAEQVSDPWIGDGRARATSHDIRRALYVFIVACLVHAALVGLLAIR